MRPDQRQRAGLGLPWLVFTVALSAGLFNLLNYHGYPLFRGEIALVLIALAVTALIMAAIRRGAGGRIGFVLTALFLAIAIDVSTSIDLGWFYAVWAVLAAAAWFAETAVLKLSLAAFGSVCAFQLAALTTGIGAPQRPDNYAKTLQAANRPAADRPAIVHLVLDSYLGLGGMALGPAHYAALRAEQSAFYTQQGFQVYPGAFSRHVKTVNSLPQLFSYGEAPFANSNRDMQYAVVDRLPYFTDLDRAGYRTSVVVPTYLDLCVNQPLTHCRKFERSALTAMLSGELSVADRATVIGYTLLQLAGLPSRAAEQTQLRANDWFGLEGRRPYNRALLLPLASSVEIDRFADDLATLKRGEARVIHLLLPHDPYLLDAQCHVRPESDWLDEHGPGSAQTREQAYAAQVRCLQSKLARMMRVLDTTRAGREAIVLIHGDHGSRISPIAPYRGGPQLSERELLMSHSTMFAIRVPGEEAGVISGTYALEDLMGDFRARDFRAAPHPQPRAPEMVLMDAQWIPRERRKLPDFE